MVTGQDWSYILHKPNNNAMKVRREGSVWVLNAIVVFEMVTTEPFFQSARMTDHIKARH